MMDSERKIEVTLSVALSQGADCPQMIFWRLEAIVQRFEMRTLLENAASSARTRFGIHLEHGFSDDEVEIVGTWLALLGRPMLVHPAEATACDTRTWLDPLFTVDDIYRPPCSGSERSEASVAARGGGYQVKRARVISVDNTGCKTIAVGM